MSVMNAGKDRFDGSKSTLRTKVHIFTKAIFSAGFQLTLNDQQDTSESFKNFKKIVSKQFFFSKKMAS